MKLEAAKRLSAVDSMDAQLSSLGLSSSEIKLYHDWTFKGTVSPTNLHEYLELFRKLSKVIPKQYKDSLPSLVYRGITTTDAVMDRFKAGTAFRIKPRALSSWTTDRDEAIEYTDSYGLLLKAKPTGVVLYIGPKVRTFLSDAHTKFPHHNKNEVICEGSPIERIDRRTAELIDY